ncbi:hypothetical protein [Culturomica massiliensis]|mgnify:CR=1 FL=1|uniref:hypothetical protein n=1 Tax=Culturomica massiliensis TaxID=1841857 RepID=UPI0026670CFD|nr:hypothetical protein [Culturomica massiliensis]
MNCFSYVSDEGIQLDEVDTMNYIRLKVNDLRKEGRSDEFIIEFVLSDHSLEGDMERIVRFLKNGMMHPLINSKFKGSDTYW